MNKLDIFCFSSAARTRNFSITARELMISQQAVSKHIKSLEDELGFRLFFRESGTVTLTKAGEYMLKFFEERTTLTDEIVKRFQGNKSTPAVTVACSQWIGCPEWLSAASGIFQKENPDVALHLLDLDAQEMQEALSVNRIDMVVTSRYMSGYLPSFWKSIIADTAALYLIRSRKSEYSMDQLELYPFFTPAAGEENDNAVILRVQNTCRTLGFIPRNINVCRDMGSVMLNVLLSRGLTIGTYALDESKNAEYSFMKTELTAEIMLCIPSYTVNRHARLFYDQLIKIREVQA